MAVIGRNQEPENVAQRVDDTNQQVAVGLAMPERGRITKLAGYLRGVSGHGNINARLCLWDGDGVLLGKTPVKNVSSGTVGVGSLVLQEGTLEEPVELVEGTYFLVGFSTDTTAGKAAQWGIYDEGTHSINTLSVDAEWPADFDTPNDGVPGGLAVWVEDYIALEEPVEPEPVSPTIVSRVGTEPIRARVTQVHLRVGGLPRIVESDDESTEARYYLQAQGAGGGEGLRSGIFSPNADGASDWGGVVFPDAGTWTVKAYSAADDAEVATLDVEVED